MRWRAFIAVAAAAGTVLGQAPDATFAGSVFNAKGRVAGAIVRLVGEDVATARAQTGSDGAFSITGPGTVLVASAPGHAVAAVGIYRGAETGDHRITLRRSFQITGRVVDNAGKPVAGVRVEAVQLATDFNVPLDLGAVDELTAVTDAAGVFRLPGLDAPARSEHSRVHLLVRDDDRAAAIVVPLRQLRATAPGLDHRVEPVRLRPIVRVTGRLLNSDTSEPIAGAQLFVQGALSTTPTTLSGEDGAWSVDFVPPCEALRLSIHAGAGHPSLVLLHEQPQQLVQAGAVRLGSVTLPPRVRVRGRVVDADDGMAAPFPLELEVRIDREVGSGFRLQGGISWGDGGASMRTDADGLFDARLPSGPVTLLVVGPPKLEAYRKAYSFEGPREIPATGHDNLVLRVNKRPGILVRWLPSNPVRFEKMRSHRAGGTLRMEISKGNSTQYADNTLVWFYPVEKWGDAVDLRVQWRSRAGAVVELLPRQQLIADPARWPREIEIEL